VLIGDMGIGKTWFIFYVKYFKIFIFSIVQRFKNGTYIEKQGTTIGVDFTMKTVVMDGKRIKLQIWFNF